MDGRKSVVGWMSGWKEECGGMDEWMEGRVWWDG